MYFEHAFDIRSSVAVGFGVTAAQQPEDLSLAESRRIGGLGDSQRQAPIPAAAVHPA
ncbi:hypothetical protein I1A62_01500 (plasmid) [Rhodococcus sp. USK10]|uniref:hypothetical protein n=1 Tax=Rhodococcus sp. USK10 TaxID=2789739 RepID=UPI001C5D43EB|nr:hypothetical protein [Rhodococcus sp. USK10]QYA99866.1 hypothetical protein I1A62_01500 [Rhodococcus sp. USK10]